MSKKGWWIVIIIIVVIVIGYAVTHKSGTQSGVVSTTGNIKLGAIEALTGDAAVLGQPQAKAIQLAVEEANKAGGINGRMLEVVQEDGKCDPQAGGAAGQKLVSIDKVAVIIGGSCSGETLAAAAITEPAGVVLISGSASSPKISNVGPYMFRTYPSDALAGKADAAYAYKALNAHKAALLTELTDYAQGLRNVYKDEFVSLGGTIVADETYTTGDTDFRTQILKIKAANPDTIYVVPQSPTPGLAIFKQLRENNVSGHYTTAEVLLDRDVVTKNATVLEGVIGGEAGVDYEHNAMAQTYAAAHKAMFNTEPGAFSANAYVATQLIIDAIKANNGKVDTKQISDYLHAVKDMPTVLGNLTIDSHGDPQLGINITKIVGGKVTNLATDYRP